MSRNPEQPVATDDYVRLIHARHALGAFYTNNPERRYAALPIDLTTGNRRSIISARGEASAEGSYEIYLYCVNGIACVGKEEPDFITDEASSRSVWLALHPLAKRRRGFYQSKRFAFYEKHLLTPDCFLTLLVRKNGRSWNASDWSRHT